MAIVGVTSDILMFQCPKCLAMRKIPWCELRVFAHGGARHHASIILPPCECGTRSDIVPGFVEEDHRNHIRRCAWKRSVSLSSFFNEDSEKEEPSKTERFDSFYAQPGREALRAQYDDPTITVEVVARAQEK